MIPGEHDSTLWGETHVPGDLVFKLAPTASLNDVAHIISKHNADRHITAEALASLDIHRFVCAGSSEDLAKDLLGTGLVEWAEPDQASGKLCLIPNDPLYTGTPGEWHLQTMSFPSAWNISTGTTWPIIADVNTGIDVTHPDFDFTNRVVTGYNILDGTTNTNDVYFHGTACAGVMCATTNNNIGVAAADWTCRIMPILITNDATVTSANAAAGINKAVALGANIINCSFTGVSGSVIETACQAATDAGVLCAASTGNGGPTAFGIGRPASYPTWIGLWATDINDNATTYDQVNSVNNLITQKCPINVAAPGGDTNGNMRICVLVSQGTYAYSSGGTSFSCPLLCGVASLCLAVNPTLSGAQLHYILTNPANMDPVTGFVFATGRLNAQKALQMAQAMIVQSNPTIWVPSTESVIFA